MTVVVLLVVPVSSSPSSGEKEAAANPSTPRRLLLLLIAIGPFFGSSCRKRRHKGLPRAVRIAARIGRRAVLVVAIRTSSSSAKKGLRSRRGCVNMVNSRLGWSSRNDNEWRDGRNSSNKWLGLCPFFCASVGQAEATTETTTAGKDLARGTLPSFHIMEKKKLSRSRRARRAPARHEGGLSTKARG